MYSKIKIAGHPIHPMLISFPVAFYAAALVLFCAYALGASAFWFRVGVYANLAGVIMAVVAAVPGFLDWALGVPKGTEAKRTGATHMVLNVVALVLFAINVFVQWPHRMEAAPGVGLAVILPLAGVITTLAAGWLGWRLVQTHHIGIELSPDQERVEPIVTAPRMRAKRRVV